MGHDKVSDSTIIHDIMLPIFQKREIYKKILSPASK